MRAFIGVRPDVLTPPEVKLNRHLAWRVTLLLSLGLLLADPVSRVNPAWTPIRSTVDAAGAVAAITPEW